MTAQPVVWSARVRYAEVDQQGVVFNSHYLLYCDEAMAVFCRRHGLADLAEQVRLVASTLQWRSPARYGDTVEVAVDCRRVGRTSLTLGFLVRVGDRLCCEVETTYVNTDAGIATPILDDVRTALLAPASGE